MSVPRCLLRSRHSWRPSNAIGCRENPGCVDTGNGAILWVDVCAHCDMRRHTVKSYCGRTRDNRTEYFPSDY